MMEQSSREHKEPEKRPPAGHGRKEKEEEEAKQSFQGDRKERIEGPRNLKCFAAE